MSIDSSNINQWQLWRDVSAEDTLLTDYKPADLTATVKGKMLAIKPAMAIALRAFTADDDGDTAILHISGWMHPEKDPGIGQVLYVGTVTSGAFVQSAGIILAPGCSSQTWREVDTWTPVANKGIAVPQALQIAAGAGTGANATSMLLLPTYGYTHLLLEVRDIGGGGTEANRVAVLARQIVRGNVPVVWNAPYS